MTQIQRETAPRVILSYSKRMARSYPRAKFLLFFWCSCGYLPVHWMTLSYTFVPVLPWRIFRIHFLLFLLIVSLLWCPFCYKELLVTISVILICWLSIFPLRDPNNNWEIDWNIFSQHKVLLWQSNYIWTGATWWKDGSKTTEILFYFIGVEEWRLSVTSFGMLGAPHAIMRALCCELRKLELSGAFLRTLSLTNFFFWKRFVLAGTLSSEAFVRKKLLCSEFVFWITPQRPFSLGICTSLYCVSLFINLKDSSILDGCNCTRNFRNTVNILASNVGLFTF